MSDKSSATHRRILVIDGDQAIQDEIGNILNTVPPGRSRFQVEPALQAQEGLELALRARQEGQPYSLVFIDVRMLQGGNEAEIPRRLLEADPDLQLIFCAVESDGSLEESLLTPGSTDQFVIMKKPFDSLGVRQMVLALTEKWRLAQETRRCRNAMEELVREREQAEAALARQSNLLGALMDNIPDNVYFKDREGRFLRTSRAQAEFLGLSDPSGAVGKSDFDFYPREDARSFFDDEQRIIRTGQPVVNKEEKQTYTNGRVAWISTTKWPLRDREGNIIGTFGISSDVTERKQAQESLAYERYLLKALMDDVPDYIYFKDLESRFTRISHSQAKRFGLHDPSDAFDKTDFDFFTVEHAQPAFDDEQQIIRTGQPIVNKEERETHPDGRVTWVSTIKEPLRDPQGAIIGTFGVSRDITERKQAEQALRESEARLRKVAETNEEMFRQMTEIIGQIFWLADPSVSRMIYVSPAYEEIWGCRRESLYQSPKAWLEAIHPEDRERVILSLPQPMTKPFAVEYRILRPDGSVRWIADRRFPVRDQSGLIYQVAGVAEDITETKLAEDALARERNLLRTLIETIPDRIYAKDTEARFILNNIAHLHALGARSQAEATGKTDFDFRPAQLATRSMADDRQVLQTGLPLNNREESTILANGETGWLLATKVPLRDPQNEIVGLVGISRDITDRKHTETMMENLHKQLLDTSRQAGMAEVATNVLHNVGNVLNSMNVSLGLVSDRVRKSRIANLARATGLIQEHKADLAAYLLGDSKGSQLPGYLIQLASHLTGEQADNLKELQLLQGNLEHIKEIVAMQQNYSKIAGVVETLPVAELIEDALRMNTAALARHEVQVVREYAEVPPVVVERHKVLQILVNLIRNAKYALDEGGRMDRRLTLRVAHNGGDFVHILVIDNGVGISTENLNRIFEHGFTTRKEGHGFGLHSGALAAREMGGTLTVSSEGVGKGATFTLALPTQPRTEGS